ncbi:MAG: hypothetical protein ABR574_05045 [Cryomorphaceae bacterium]
MNRTEKRSDSIVEFLILGTNQNLNLNQNKMANSGLGCFIVGTAVGVGVGFYLNSEEGKKWREERWSDAVDLEAKIEEKVNEALQKMKGKVNETATKVKDATEPK